MDRVPKTINIIPTIFIFLSFITIFGNIATNLYVCLTKSDLST